MKRKYGTNQRISNGEIYLSSLCPESNGLAEAFVKTFKRDYVWFGDLENAETVMSQLPHWFEDYNEKAPHKALKMRSPREHLKEQKLAG